MSSTIETRANVLSPFVVAVDDLILWTRFVTYLSGASWYYDALTLRLLSIESNCVIIGACILTLYPFIKRTFGGSALGSTKTDSSERKQRPALQTIGSYVINKQRPGHLSVLDTVEDVVGEERENDMAERQMSENSGETTF